MSKPLAWASRRTTLVQMVAVGLVIGLGLAGAGWRSSWFLVFGSISLILISLKRRQWLGIGLLILWMNIGILRGSSVKDSFLQLQNHYGQTGTVAGRIADDAAISDRFQSEFIPRFCCLWLR